MSTSTRKFALAYVVLVGLPIVGLLGTLRQGRHLSAPIGMDGNWVLQGKWTDLPCGMSAVPPESAVLNLSQSGPKFELSLPNGLHTEESGTITGTNLKATLSLSPEAKSECSPNQSVSLLATLNKDARPRTLEGTMMLEGCTSCSPVPFTAVRQKPVVKKGAH